MGHDRVHPEGRHFELTEAELSTVSAGEKHTSGSNSFLNLSDIKGESTDKGHKDSIEILSF